MKSREKMRRTETLGRVSEMLKIIRNAASFVFTWLCALAVIFSLIGGRKELGVAFLLKTLGFSMATAIIFAAAFGKVLIRNKGFVFRLNLFLIFFLPVEIWWLYAVGIFATAGSIRQWMLFGILVLILYLTCLFLDVFYFRKQGEKYTYELKEYQERRLNYGKYNEEDVK